MSVSLVWFAVQGIAPDTLLERAGFVDTGEIDEYYEAEFTGCMLPSGWYVMMAEEVELIDIENLREWSDGGRLVAVVVQETGLFSLATEWREGKPVWSVSHEPDDAGEPVISLDGKLPDVFEEVRREYVEQQDGATPAELVFMAPIELAWRITGFRHDTLGFEEVPCPFTVLAEA